MRMTEEEHNDKEILDNRVNSIEKALETAEVRLEFLKDELKTLRSVVIDTVIESVQLGINKLDVKEDDIVAFVLPEGLEYSEEFFNGVSSIFSEKNINVIAVHKGIDIKIVSNSDGVVGD